MWEKDKTLFNRRLWGGGPLKSTHWSKKIVVCLKALSPQLNQTKCKAGAEYLKYWKSSNEQLIENASVIGLSLLTDGVLTKYWFGGWNEQYFE